jgi:hypothetical protein
LAADFTEDDAIYDEIDGLREMLLEVGSFVIFLTAITTTVLLGIFFLNQRLWPMFSKDLFRLSFLASYFSSIVVESV